MKNNKLILIMLVYLFGIFMGALDTGIVTPARTVIQKDLFVDDKTGIWMITMYTLAYAAIIPVAGKLADRFGRKYVYLISIFLFGLGSLLCGLSQHFESFSMLIFSRAIQALGGGGIIPIATAEVGTAVPKEKRGLALGLVGGVFGIANLFGATAGSAILDIFGSENWQYIFYINIPITLFILVTGFLTLPNTKMEQSKKIDFLGIAVLTVMILSLLYGIENIDFFDLANTLALPSAYPFFLIFLATIPIFLFIERKAEDPVINLSYFQNSNILITLLLAFITGVILIATIFIPQFSENALKMASGSGGYFVFVLALFSGVGAPLSGKLIDKYGVKPVLGLGFVATTLGALYIVLVTLAYPTLANVIISLILIGFGMGFTIGTPLNYMMLDNTPKEESNSALATLSLIRSIGTAIAPAIMVGFIAHAGMNVQTNVFNLLPKEISVPPLPYAEELTQELTKLKSDPNMKDQLSGMNTPDLTAYQKVKIDMSADSNVEVPEDLITLLKSSDVTSIVANVKTFAGRIFTDRTPEIIADIEKGLNSGIDGMLKASKEIDQGITELEKGISGLSEGIAGMKSALSAQDQALQQLESISAMIAKIPPAALQGGLAQSGLGAFVPENVKTQLPRAVLDELNQIKSVDQLQQKIKGLEGAKQALRTKVESSQKSLTEMKTSLTFLQTAKANMQDTVSKMNTLKAAVPTTFAYANALYLEEIESRREAIEGEFQITLNHGFRQVYIALLVATVLAFLLLFFYHNRKNSP